VVAAGQGEDLILQGPQDFRLALAKAFRADRGAPIAGIQPFFQKIERGGTNLW
jgi:hypothetical protein